MAQPKPTKEESDILASPFYADIRQDLGEAKEQELLAAIAATQHDRSRLQQILFVGIPILVLLILVVFGTGMDPLLGIGLIIALSVPLVGLLLTLTSIRPQEATTRTLFGEPTGRMASPHYYWLKFRVQHGFWKAVMVHHPSPLSPIMKIK
jgi:hypothetical protein